MAKVPVHSTFAIKTEASNHKQLQRDILIRAGNGELSLTILEDTEFQRSRETSATMNLEEAKALKEALDSAIVHAENEQRRLR